MELCRRSLPRSSRRLTQFVDRLYNFDNVLASAPAEVRIQAQSLRHIIAESRTTHMSDVRREFLQRQLDEFYNMVTDDGDNVFIRYDQEQRAFVVEWTAYERTALRFEGEVFVGTTETSISCSATGELSWRGSRITNVTLTAGEIDDHYGEDGWTIFEEAFVMYGPSCDVSAPASEIPMSVMPGSGESSAE